MCTAATSGNREEVNKDPTADPTFTTSVLSLAVKQEVGFDGKIVKKKNPKH